VTTTSQPTLADIATRAGVSLSTVSHILNDRQAGRFSDQTVRRVRTLATELGYQTRQARGKGFVGTSEQVNRIAFFYHRQLSSVSSSRWFHMYTQAIDALQNAARAGRYEVLLATGLADGESQEAFLRQSLRDSVDGWIVAGAVEPQTAQVLREKDFPAVFIGDQMLNADSGGAIVCGDNVLGGYQLTRLALQRGHERIAFIGCTSTNRFYRLRCNGYMEALLEANLDIDRNLIHDPDLKTESMASFVERQLETPNGATCIVAGSRRLAEDALAVLHQRQARVPHDMSLVSYDADPALATLDPPVTCAGPSGMAIGHLAFRRLMDLIEKPDSPRAVTLVPTDLVERDSLTAPPIRK